MEALEKRISLREENVNHLEKELEMSNALNNT